MAEPTTITIPDGWQVVSLGEIARLRRGTVRAAEDDPLPYIALEHIRSNGTINGCGKASDSVSPKTAFCKGDTLYGKLRPNLRKVVRVDTDGVCSTDILAVYANDLVDDMFLSHLLRGDLLHEHAMKGITGTRMPRTSWNHLQKFKLLLPPYNQQQNIARLLDSIDKVIKRTEAVMVATHRLRNAVLHDLLARGLPGWHTEWRDVPGIGSIPAEWQTVCLGDVCDPPMYGAGLPACSFDPKLPRYVRITDITEDGRLRIDDIKSASSSDSIKYELCIGDLLFARSGSVGRTYLYRSEDGPCIFAGYLIKFRPNPEIALPQFVSLCTHSRFYRRWVASMGRVGAQPNINASEYSTLLIPLPTLPEQQVIVSIIDAISELLGRIRNEQDATTVLKSSMSDKLLSGVIR